MTTPGGENWKITVMSWPYDTHVWVSMRGGMVVVIKCSLPASTTQIHLFMLAFTHVLTTAEWNKTPPIYYCSHILLIERRNCSFTSLLRVLAFGGLYICSEGCSIYVKQLKEIFWVLWRSEYKSHIFHPRFQGIGKCCWYVCLFVEWVLKAHLSCLDS